ncbi:hypothetical protein ACQ4PT_054886 [Festuca glaucescens]
MMEATAVSLARSVLQGVLSSAGSAVADEVASLLGVPREVDFIRNELEMMHSFLLVTSTRPDAAVHNDTVRTWVKQVRDLAYDVEDCLFEFALHSSTASRWPSCLTFNLGERHNIAERIRDLKTSVEELNRRNQRYHVVVDPPRGAGEVDAEAQQPLLPYNDVTSAAELAFQEWDIIGRSKEKEALIKELMSDGDGKLGVVSVWGMGGMGKSSLVSMVRNDPELLDAYDCGAWVTVPHPLDSTDTFMRRLRKGLGLGAAPRDDDDDIKEHLRGKRYMIVVDDVLTKEEWDQVSRKLFTFQKDQNAKGSRVIVTTRREDVALYCAANVGKGHGHVQELKPLGDEESKILLYSKVYKTTTLMDKMEEQASLILKRCRGLPLAISTIGGAFNVGQGNGVARRLEQLTDLQRLGVTVTSLTEKGCQELCQSIGKLSRLQKLEVRSRSLEFLAKMDELEPPKHLASLKLLGDLSLLPTWITSLNDLTKLKLLGTNLVQAQVDTLGSLRNMAFLGLWEKSYKGESLRFSAGNFPKLKFLDIDGLEKIEKVTIEKGSMPQLEKLWANNCIELCNNSDGLSGVPDLENLDELLLKKCGEKENLMEILQEHVSRHNRRPKFLIGKIVRTSSKPSTSAAAEQQ